MHDLNEKIILDDQGFIIYDAPRYLTFESTDSHENKPRYTFKIDKSEILSVKNISLSDTCLNQCLTWNNPTLRRKKSFFRLVNPKSLKSVAYSDDSDHSKNPTIIDNTLTLFFLLRAKKFRWRISSLVCHFQNESIRNFWSSKLDEDTKSYGRPIKLLVFVNPFGGKGKAKKVYKDLVEPILRLSNINFDVIQTERANHARDIVLQNDLSNIHGILSVGGDGLFSEILNGLLVRTQNDAGINLDDKNAHLQKTALKLAAIPAGSTNAFAYTLNGTDDPLTAVLHVALGDSRNVDVCAIHCGQKFNRFACTAVSFGFLGDVLKCSENLRYLGPPRYLVAGLKMTLKHPIYRGNVEFCRTKVPFQTKTPGVIQSTLPVNVCHSTCDICKSASSPPNKLCGLKEQRKGLEIQYESENKTDTEQETILLNDVSFIHLIGVITPALCKLAPSGLSPTCHLGDGLMHLALVAPISRLRNGLYIANVMGRKANHLSKSFVKVHQVTKFSFARLILARANKFESKVEDFDAKTGSKLEMESESYELNKRELSNNDSNGKYGTWNVDGEIFYQPSGYIHFTMHKQLISIFARGIELDHENTE